MPDILLLEIFIHIRLLQQGNYHYKAVFKFSTSQGNKETYNKLKITCLDPRLPIQFSNKFKLFQHKIYNLMLSFVLEFVGPLSEVALPLSSFGQLSFRENLLSFC